MLSLQRAIAYIRTMMGGATPTQHAGHAPQEPTTKRGKANTVLGTKPQSRPVKPAVKAKSARVLRATMAPSQAPEQAPVQQQQEAQSGARGRKQATPASQPVSKSPKRKPSVAPSTKAVKSRKPVLKPAQTTSGKRGSQQATHVPQTQSPAPTKRKPKTAVAQPTSVAIKPGKKRPTARQVAMVSQSKPTGSKSKTPARPTRQHAK